MTVTESQWDNRASERDAAANGDDAACTVLFGWLWRWTVQLAGSEDGAMDGWQKVVRKPRLWLEPLPYFATIIKNAGRDRERAERRHEWLLAALSAGGWTSVQHTSNAELKAIIRQAFGKLLPHDRHVMVLFLDGRSIKEMSKMCGVSPSTVRRNRERALAALRDVLRRESEGGETIFAA